MLKLRPDIESYLALEIEMEQMEKGLGLVRFTAPDDEPIEDKIKLPVGQREVEGALASASRVSQPWAQRSGSRDILDPLREIGERLFAALFEGRRNAIYRRSLRMANNAGKGLRLHLSVRGREAKAMPWEFLHDGRDFVNLSTLSPVVRAPFDILPAPLMPGVSPLRVLVVTADVTGTLQTEDEVELLESMVADSPEVALTVLRESTPDQFRDAVQGQSFHILHFVGTGIEVFGRDKQALLLAAEDSRRITNYEDASPNQLLSGSELEYTLRGQTELRLVFFNACKTHLLADEVATVSPVALGIRGDIMVPACLAFTEGLYNGILTGQALDAAVTIGRQMIDVQNPGSREWGLPVLYARTPAAPLLDRRTEAAPAERAAQPLAEAGEVPPDDPARLQEWKNLQRRINIQQRNLEALRQQKTEYGGKTPGFIEAQIEEAEGQIADLKQKLAEI